MSTRIRQAAGLSTYAAKEGQSVEAGLREFTEAVYQHQVLPADQMFEVRQGFYAGVAWLYGQMQLNAQRDEEKALQFLTNVGTALMAFSKEQTEAFAKGEHPALQKAEAVPCTCGAGTKHPQQHAPTCLAFLKWRNNIKDIC